MRHALDAEHLNIFVGRYLNQRTVYFVQRPGGDGYICKDPSKDGFIPLDNERIVAHLAGTVTLSVVAIDESGNSIWCAWDNDHSDAALDALEAVLRRLGFFPIREAKRDGRDGHTWLIFDKPIEAARLIRVAEEIRRQLGWKKGQVEFFPKSAGKLSQVRLPLGINRKPEAKGARGWFEDAPRTVPEQLAWFASQPLNDSARWNRIAEALERLDAETEKRARRQRKKQFNTQRNYEQVDIRQLAPDLKQRGGELVGPCPVCRLEGHDKHGDNLRVSLDGQKFSCVFGGPAAVHKASQIIRALTR